MHRAADGVVVVHHDAELPGFGPIAELASDELPPWLPSLEEALDACRPLEVNVEIKTDEAATGRAEAESEADDLLPLEVARLLASRPEVNRIVVSSFSLRAVDAVRAASPRLATALLVDPKEDPFSALATALVHGHGALHPFFLSVSTELVRAAKADEVAMRTWTVDQPAAIASLAEMGVDAVITNDVVTALRGARAELTPRGGAVVRPGWPSGGLSWRIVA